MSRVHDGAPARVETRNGPAVIAAAGLLVEVLVLEQVQHRHAHAAMQPPGKATVAGKFSLQLANGGVIWAEQWVPSGIAAVVHYYWKVKAAKKGGKVVLTP